MTALQLEILKHLHRKKAISTGTLANNLTYWKHLKQPLDKKNSVLKAIKSINKKTPGKIISLGRGCNGSVHYLGF